MFGAIALLMVLVPSFRNMRLFSFLALAGTTYTRRARVDPKGFRV